MEGISIINILVMLMYTKLKNYWNAFDIEILLTKDFIFHKSTKYSWKEASLLKIFKLFENHGVNCFNSLPYNIKVVE